MVLYCLDGGLGSVDAMVVRLDDLNVDLFFFYNFFDRTRTLVVHNIQVRQGTAISKITYPTLEIRPSGRKPTDPAMTPPKKRNLSS